MDPELTKIGRNLDELLPAIHGVGLLEIMLWFGDVVQRLLEKPINFFDLRTYSTPTRDAPLVMVQIAEAMKKGLLKGWQHLSFAKTFYTSEAGKAMEAVLDVHAERPPRYFWYRQGSLLWLEVDLSKRITDAEEKWRPLLVPGYNEIRNTYFWYKYVY
uniref:NmrA domain-containing protein n=1 Tax=Steinernema glaseri TaxID=37863 RepID=A0A1I7Z2M0_9BILA